MRSVQKTRIAASQAGPAETIKSSKSIASLVSILVLGMLAEVNVFSPAHADIRADIHTSLGYKTEALPQRSLVASAELRASPRPSGRSMVALVAGAKVELLEFAGEGKWAKVRTLTEPAQVGYLRADLLEEIKSGIDLGRLGGQTSSPREVALLHRNRQEEQRRAEESMRQQLRQAQQEQIRKEKAEREREEARDQARREREDAEFREQQQEYEDQRRRQSAREWAARTAPSSGVGFPPTQQRAPTGGSRLYAPVPMADVNTERRRVTEQKQYQATSPTPGAGAPTYPSAARPTDAVSAPRSSPPTRSSGATTVSPGGQAGSAAPAAPRLPAKSYDVVPTVAVGVNDTWWGVREKAIEYAQLNGVNQISTACSGKQARVDRDDKARWSYGQPNCQQGGFDGKEWKCEVRVSYPCYRNN